jgi:hypothetical protein
VKTGLRQGVSWIVRCELRRELKEEVQEKLKSELRSEDRDAKLGRSMKTSASVWTTDIGMQGQGGRYRENVPPLSVQYKNLGITITAPPFLNRSAYGVFFPISFQISRSRAGCHVQHQSGRCFGIEIYTRRHSSSPARSG